MLLGFAGGLLWTPADRASLGLLLGGFFLLIGALGVTGRWVAPIQVDRETSYEWLDGRVPWAIRNGAALGAGFTSRLGFQLWYAVPVSASLFGSPFLGACLYGAYALTRSGAAVVQMALVRRRLKLRNLLELRAFATRVTSAFLLVAGAVAVGLLV
ncbi:hypothetical protein [Baekduia sp.]|uniref:hypothetical protein n=1 Tax=Baekduia sp. TaxID=2600305 RepID=UPI002D1FAC6A|nr:hypothetical protein [Baekduia sp.]